MDQKRQEYIRGLCMMDDLLMSVVLQNKECARLVLRIILEDPGLEVEEVHTQETVNLTFWDLHFTVERMQRNAFSGVK